MLAKYLAAEQSILEGKAVRLGERSLQLEDLAEVRQGRREWEARVQAEAASAAEAPTLGGLGFSLAKMDE